MGELKNKIMFVVQRPPYKSEDPKLALTHALSSGVTSIHIDEEIVPTVAFIGDGVLNCIKDQKSMEAYGITSNERHIKNMLATDTKTLVCKEDIERLGIKEDRLIDASDMGAEMTIKVVLFNEILKEMEANDHLMFF
jgi:sulfur relay (sulfurtransferase) DsrF/TusC family protein